MPAITIKESPVYHYTALADAPKVCKFLVEQLVSLDPFLNLDTVVTDTTSQYKAIIRVSGSNVGFQIYNNGTAGAARFEEGVWKSDGTFVVTATYNLNNLYFTPGAGGNDVKVSIVGVDGALKYAVIRDRYFSNTIVLTYGMFTSETSEGPVYVCSAFVPETSAVWPTPPAVPVGTSYPIGYYNPDLDIREAMTFIGSDDVTAWARAGHPYGLHPKGYSAYTPTKGFLNLKWGGAYDLYVLYDATGSVVSTVFGETVSINGVSTLSGGTVALIV